jgi:hypothetical protein
MPNCFFAHDHRENKQDLILSQMYCRWSLKVSLSSKKTPRNFILLTCSIFPKFCTSRSMLILGRLPLKKVTSLVLSFPKEALFAAAHKSASCRIFLIVVVREAVSFLSNGMRSPVYIVCPWRHKFI